MEKNMFLKVSLPPSTILSPYSLPQYKSSLYVIVDGSGGDVKIVFCGGGRGSSYGGCSTRGRGGSNSAVVVEDERVEEEKEKKEDKTFSYPSTYRQI